LNAKYLTLYVIYGAEFTAKVMNKPSLLAHTHKKAGVSPAFNTLITN
tara:strand:+ start:735 stop:875 length:141 start_codon:yes stop_codon:yes gene_type:complete